MLDISKGEDGSIRLRGRLDAVAAEKQAGAFAEFSGPCVLDCKELDYISSAGLGLLFGTHKKLMATGGGLRLINLKPHIRELFAIAHFDSIFQLD
jgi:anti-sigma B factor antagonist